MGVTILPSTLDGGWTPICSDCGIVENFDISEKEYQEDTWFWDHWTCKECKKFLEKPAKEYW